MQVITSVLVLGLCFVAFVIADIKGYKEREVSNETSIAQVIGANTISAISFWIMMEQLKYYPTCRKCRKI
ncbi:MAG: hypothetical protein WDM71_09360 [Ferruginibacter sp.]